MTLWRKWQGGEKKETAAQRTGRLGEDRACAYLEQEKHFHVVKRNWREGSYELDLVAWDGPVLVVVEVKTRQKEGLIPPRVAIDRRKKQSLRKGIYAYLKTLSYRPKAVRFDVVEIINEPRHGPGIRHYANIPLFSKYFRP